jgi:uncharacterized protein YabE (DUF348 family)/3D (Asp-Asp-Asp) domain-containing protein
MNTQQLENSNTTHQRRPLRRGRLKQFFKDPTPFCALELGQWYRLIAAGMAMLALVCLIVGLICLRALLTPRRQIIFSDEGVSVQVETAAKTVGEFLSSMSVSLEPGDTVSANVYDDLVSGQHLHVRRGMTVYIADNANPDAPFIALRTQAGTVNSLMHSGSADGVLGGNIGLSGDTVLTPGMVIGVDNVKKEIVTQTDTIAYHTITKTSSSIALGTSYVETPGQEGQKQTVTQIITVNGQEVSRTVLSEITLTQAVDEVLVQGSKTAAPKPTATPKPTRSAAGKTAQPTARATKTPATVAPDQTTVTVNGTTYPVRQTLSVTTTAYTHTGNKTSSGVWPSVGTIAVDKSVIPMGTKIYVPGYGIGIAQDSGVSGNHIDLFMDTYDECILWGRQTKTIYILE